MGKFNREDMRRRFWELTAEREKFFGDNKELYERRDILATELTPLTEAFTALNGGGGDRGDGEGRRPRQ